MGNVVILTSLFSYSVLYIIIATINNSFSVPQYMGFGASGNDQFTWMDEADVVIAWVNSSRGAHAVDYHLSGRFQVKCSIVSGNHMAYGLAQLHPKNCDL